MLWVVGTGLNLPATAGELHLLVNGKAIHIDPPPTARYNEQNWGGGLQYDFDPVSENWIPYVTISGFRDSHKNPSYYAGGGLLRRIELVPAWDGLHVDAGIVMFMMTREDYKDNRPFFGVLPAFSIGTNRASVNISYVPQVHPKMTALFFFQLKIKLAQF